MIQHEVGVNSRSVRIPKIGSDYFDEEAACIAIHLSHHRMNFEGPAVSLRPGDGERSAQRSC